MNFRSVQQAYILIRLSGICHSIPDVAPEGVGTAGCGEFAYLKIFLDISLTPLSPFYVSHPDQYTVRVDSRDL